MSEQKKARTKIGPQPSIHPQDALMSNDDTHGLVGIVILIPYSGTHADNLHFPTYDVEWVCDGL